MRHALVAAIVVLAAPAAAQEKKETPAQVEASVRRRVESWLRERAPSKLQCPVCREDGAKRPCETCGDSRMNPHRVDNAIWNFLRPSYRRGKKKDDWIRENVIGRGGRWGTQHLMCDARVGEVLLTRDVAWVTVVAGEGAMADEVKDAWIRDGNAFYLDMTQEVADQLVHDEWFVLGTFSINAFSREVERMVAPEDSRELTDLERSRMREERQKAEDELAKRVVADLGNVDNVRRIPGRTTFEDGERREEPPSFEVVVLSGATRVRVRLPAGEDPKATEERLSGLSRGTRVVFRGKPHEWTRSERLLSLEAVLLVEGELRAAE